MIKTGKFVIPVLNIVTVVGFTFVGTLFTPNNLDIGALIGSLIGTFIKFKILLKIFS